MTAASNRAQSPADILLSDPRLIAAMAIELPDGFAISFVPESRFIDLGGEELTEPAILITTVPEGFEIYERPMGALWRTVASESVCRDIRRALDGLLVRYDYTEESKAADFARLSTDRQRQLAFWSARGRKAFANKYTPPTEDEIAEELCRLGAVAS